MIHKLRFGKRVGTARRRLGLSQTALAERLGVTPQAVSRWECGTALPDIELLLELSRLFGVTVNELLEDRDPVAAMQIGESARDGVYSFVPDGEDPFGEYAADAGLIAENWRKAKKRMYWDEAGRRIAEKGGLVLEIGAGPGGGFLPFILRADPNASVVVSDLSPGIVREWKRFLDAEGRFPNLWYAACDFTALPFPDASFDTVSDGGGIVNAVGSRREAFREAYRVLKPGGMLVSFCGFVPRDALLSLPEEAREVLLAEMPGAFDDLYEMTATAGFSRIDSMRAGGWDTHGGDSGFSALCGKLGVSLRFTADIRICGKS